MEMISTKRQGVTRQVKRLQGRLGPGKSKATVKDKRIKSAVGQFMFSFLVDIGHTWPKAVLVVIWNASCPERCYLNRTEEKAQMPFVSLCKQETSFIFELSTWNCFESIMNHFMHEDLISLEKDFNAFLLCLIVRDINDKGRRSLLKENNPPLLSSLLWLTTVLLKQQKPTVVETGSGADIWWRCTPKKKNS